MALSIDLLNPLLVPSAADSNELVADPQAVEVLLSEVLHLVRVSLGLEMAFISEFTDGRRVFRHVDADERASGILQLGGSDCLEESYCQRVVDGRLPELIQNATDLPEARAMPVTISLPVGAHLSVPIRFSDGHVYGTFCCFSRQPDSSLSGRDLNMLRTFAQMASRLLELTTTRARTLAEKAKRIQAVLDSGDFSPVYQPIFRIADRTVVGYEALTRFQCEPLRSPDQWFAEAAEVGMGYQLECAAGRKALAGLPYLPKDTYLSLNVSPHTILNCEDPDLLVGLAPQRLVLEVTEHSTIEDYAEIASVLAPLRKRGLRLAVDDAGAGYASFRHILQLKPDIIKLDRSLISGLNENQDQLALAAALVSFAEKTGIKVVAEGVETPEELKALQALNVNKAQGYLLGRPTPLRDIVG